MDAVSGGAMVENMALIHAWTGDKEKTCGTGSSDQHSARSELCAA